MTIIKLKDGREFNAVTKQIVGQADELPMGETPSVVSYDPVPLKELRLEDLPVDPKQMSVVGAILTFKLMGLPDRDICDAIGCTAVQLNDIMDSEAFSFAKQSIVDGFVNAQKHGAREVIGANAILAANKVVKIMSSKNEQNALKAAESILNRVGVGGDADNPMAGGLVIKILKDTAATEINISMKG